MVELCLTHGCKKIWTWVICTSWKIQTAPHPLIFTPTRKYLSSFFLSFPLSLPFIVIRVNVCYMVLLLQHSIKIVLFAAMYISWSYQVTAMYTRICLICHYLNVMLYDLREIKCVFLVLNSTVWATSQLYTTGVYILNRDDSKHVDFQFIGCFGLKNFVRIFEQWASNCSWGGLVWVWPDDSHYANTPMQYTAIFHGCKNSNFQMKNYNIFLIFAQNIDCGYTLEPPQ